MIDRVEAVGGSGEHREEGDDPGAGKHCRLLRQVDLGVLAGVRAAGLDVLDAISHE